MIGTSNYINTTLYERLKTYIISLIIFLVPFISSMYILTFV